MEVSAVFYKCTYCVFTLYGRSLFLQFLINKYSLYVANLYFAITGSKVNIKKLFEMSAGQKCCVIGTLFKSMELKPNILKEISKDVSKAATFIKLDPYQNAQKVQFFFSIALFVCASDFKVKTVYPLDGFQCAISRAMPLHKLK